MIMIIIVIIVIIVIIIIVFSSWTTRVQIVQTAKKDIFVYLKNTSESM